MSRNSWALSIAWIILSCYSGGGGIFKWFLELPIWQPLGRMSLSFYLVHTLVITVFVGSYRAPLHFSNFYLVNLNLSCDEIRIIKLKNCFSVSQFCWRFSIFNILFNRLISCN